MSLLERIDDLRDDIESNKTQFEEKSNEAENDIQTVVYNLEMEVAFDNPHGGDFSEQAEEFDDMAQMVREQIGELESVIGTLEEAANIAREIHDAQDELGDFE